MKPLPPTPCPGGAKTAFTVSGLILWAYARHLFTFSVGAALGAAAGMSVTTMMFLALLKSRGLL
jgi:hypothetical protein